MPCALQENYNFDNLHTATFKLTDFGRAVLYKQLAAQPGSLLDAAPPLQDERQLSMQAAAAPIAQKIVVHVAESGVSLQPAPYELDGVTMTTDPWLRPPEVS
jgi:hypothetical protein